MNAARFAFSITKAKSHDWHYTVHRNGQLVAEGWTDGTRAEARAEAQKDAEPHGYIDGVSK